MCSATLTQHAIAKFFETGRYDLHMRNLRKKLHSQCLRYTQAISEYFPVDTKISQPDGGYVFWIELPKNVNAFDVFYQATEAKISIAPGQLFSLDKRFSNYIRITFVIPYSKVMDNCLKLLGEIINNLAMAGRRRSG